MCQTLCVHINIYYLCTHTYVISFNSYEKLLKKFIRRNQSWKNLSNLPKLSLWFLLGFVWLQSVYQCSCDIVFQYRFIHNSQGLCIHLLLCPLAAKDRKNESRRRETSRGSLSELCDYRKGWSRGFLTKMIHPLLSPTLSPFTSFSFLYFLSISTNTSL